MLWETVSKPKNRKNILPYYFLELSRKPHYQDIIVLLTIANQLGNKLNHMAILIFAAVSGSVLSFVGF